MERIESERCNSQLIASAVPVQMTPISRVELAKLTPASVGVHTEEDTGSDLIDAQYINIHRVPEALVTKGLVTSTLSGDILSHHVVDLGGSTDFGQHSVGTQYYDTDDLLSQDLNDDDRRLAAALVTVQLVQQQKQQQQQHPTVITTDLLGTKAITAQLTPVTSVNMVKPEMAAMVGLTNCYIQAVEEEAAQQQLLEEHQNQEARIMKLYHQQPTSQQEIKLQPLPPLKKVLSSQSMGIRNKYDRPVAIQNIGENQTIEQQISVIQEDITGANKEEELDSDYGSSRRSLPHKKRIPKKLKAPPARNIHAKCYKCNKCGESFTSQAAFATHRATHSVPAKRLPVATTFSCELCNKLFSTQIKFFEHLKSHYEPIQSSPLPSIEPAPTVISLQNVNPPPTIEGTFTIKTEDLASQVIKDEVVSTSTLPCPQCGKLFRRQKALETHVSVAHPSQEDIEEFSEPEDMMEGIRHVVNIQGTDSGEEDHCEDKLRQWRYGEVQEMGMDLQEMCLGLTSNNDSNGEKSKTRRNKQLSCTICSRAFNHRNSLLYHERSHSGQRPHQCEVCGKSFFASSALKVHMRLHSGDKPYKCEFCGRHFRQWGDLKYHVTSLHSDQKQFQCEYCGKDFARKYSLIVHRRIHTGEKNYHCEFCNKTFRASSYLQNHRRIHTGEKPHPCDVCGKPFRVRSDMKRHRNTHTGERGTRRTVSSAEANSEGEEEVAQQVTEPETIIPDATPLNLNVRNSDSDDGMTYTRGEAVGRDGNTLFVWIPTQNGNLLIDE